MSCVTPSVFPIFIQKKGLDRMFCCDNIMHTIRNVKNDFHLCFSMMELVELILFSSNQFLLISASF